MNHLLFALLFVFSLSALALDQKEICDPKKNAALKLMINKNMAALKSAANETYPQERFIDKEVKPRATAYSSKGHSWRDCETNKSLCVAWPDAESHIWQVGEPEEAVMADIYSDHLINRSFTPVVICYVRKFKSEITGKESELPQLKFGYIQSGQLSKKVLKPVFQEPSAPSNALSDLIGKCVLKPSQSVGPYSENPYDHFALTEVVDEKGRLRPEVQTAVAGMRKSTGEPVTAQDVVAIDAIARTLIAEMAKCFSEGIQYPMAVTRIIYNRSEYGRRSETAKFLLEGPPAKRNPAVASLAKAATNPMQFDVWKRYSGESSLRRALCPPTQIGKPFFSGSKTGPKDIEIWKTAVRLASDMVLDPIGFKAKTSEMVYSNYVSCMKLPWKKMTEITGIKIADRELTSKECIRIGYDPVTLYREANGPLPGHVQHAVDNNLHYCKWEEREKEKRRREQADKAEKPKSKNGQK